MANYTTPPPHASGELITAADWNTYIKANWESLTGVIGYSLAAISGWSEYTTARGVFILAAPSGGTLGTAVGTPLTNLQQVTHTHTVTRSWGTGGPDTNGILMTNNTGGTGYPAGTSGASSDATSGTANAVSIGMPYIQLLCIKKD